MFVFNLTFINSFYLWVNIGMYIFVAWKSEINHLTINCGNMKAFFEKFESLKGSSFIGIREYQNKFGKVANVNLLTNISTMNAKKKDLEKLKKVDDLSLALLVAKTGIKLEVFKVALSKMIASGEKNISSDLTEHTAQSQGQSEAYIHLAPGVKLHKDSMNVFIDGFFQSEEVLVEGEYPTVKSADKTKAKKAIGKLVELRMNDYHQYNLGNADQLIVKGTTLQIMK